MENVMFEIARQLEQTAVWFEPAVLIVPGIAAVLFGLFVWLGGLGFRRILVAIAGAVSGGICGFFVSGQNIMPAVVSAGVVMVFAIILDRIFILMLTGVLAAVLCFAFLAGPYIESKDNLENHPGKMTVSLNTRESVEVMKGYAADFAAEVKRIFLHMSVYERVVPVVVAVLFMAAGFYWQRLTSAFCCAALGAILICAGMILLLLYKGAAPISRVCQNQTLYQSIFGIVTAFGMATQLLLCPRIGLAEKKQKGKNKIEPVPVSENWRGR
jgi:hypothetical protein